MLLDFLIIRYSHHLLQEVESNHRPQGYEPCELPTALSCDIIFSMQIYKKYLEKENFSQTFFFKSCPPRVRTPNHRTKICCIANYTKGQENKPPRTSRLIPKAFGATWLTLICICCMVLLSRYLCAPSQQCPMLGSMAA